MGAFYSPSILIVPTIRFAAICLGTGVCADAEKATTDKREIKKIITLLNSIFMILHTK